MERRFAGKVALVTGGSSGIGRAAALAFAREGATVIVADVDAPGGEETVRQIHAADGGAAFVACDVTRDAAVAALIERATTTYGRLDYALNNAGVVGSGAATADLTEEEWDRTLAVNLKGVWLCMRHEIPAMLARGGGAIVNTASILGLRALPGAPAYVASKHGVIGLTKATALAYAKSGLRVNAVCPGNTRTSATERLIDDAPNLAALLDAQVPRGSMGAPGEIAAAVVWLCSDAASFVNGAALSVDGGMAAQL